MLPLHRSGSAPAAQQWHTYVSGAGTACGVHPHSQVKPLAPQFCTCVWKDGDVRRSAAEAQRSISLKSIWLPFKETSGLLLQWNRTRRERAASQSITYHSTKSQGVAGISWGLFLKQSLKMEVKETRGYFEKADLKLGGGTFLEWFQPSFHPALRR